MVILRKFNKKLSQLEAIHRIAPPVCRNENSLNISDFIHHIFENQEKYDLQGMSKDWFVNFSKRDTKGSFNLINKILQESDNIISKKCILEGIEKFKSDES